MIFRGWFDRRDFSMDLTDFLQSLLELLRLKFEFAFIKYSKVDVSNRGGSTAAATSKMERFVIIDNGFLPLTIITKRSILDVVAALDPPLSKILLSFCFSSLFEPTLHENL